MHFAILSAFIKLPFVIKNFVLSIFEWPFYTGLLYIILILVYFQLTQQLEDIKKLVDGKDADIAKLKTSLDQSGKEMKQLQNQHAKDLEKAASEKEKLERYDIEVYQGSKNQQHNNKVSKQNKDEEHSGS